jgi:hypothetical protein
LASAQRNRMNDQSIFVNEAGGNEALGEPSASMRKDEIARLFLQSEDFIGLGETGHSTPFLRGHRKRHIVLAMRRVQRAGATRPIGATAHKGYGGVRRRTSTRRRWPLPVLVIGP